MSELLEALLNKPTAPATPARKPSERDVSSKLEVDGDTAEVTLRDRPGVVHEGTALAFLQEQGLNPEEYEVASFKRSLWGSTDEPLESVSFTFRKIKVETAGTVGIDELLKVLDDHKPEGALHPRNYGASAFIVALGDMQFGKMDGDGPSGALDRTLSCLDRARDEYERLTSEGYRIGHVHVAWLGDHIEGFVSQGGANVWRTTLTLNEQIRLTRRVMLYALELFAPLAERVTMAAIPGNHGEAQRFNGKGVTRYDDSHDTESLVAVADAAALNPDRFSHVEFFVPETDELTVVVEAGGARIAHAHGHQWRPNKQFEWWKGQAFNPDSAMHMADILLAGHLHHLHVESDGRRLYVGVPALEAESTWWRHSTGTGGSPGIVTALVTDGRFSPMNFVSA